MEKIEQGKNRVDIEKLSPADVSETDMSGGYLLKKDWIEGGAKNLC
jgi:hypothetical protein